MRDKVAIEAQLAKFRKEYADINEQFASYDKALPATQISFDVVCNLREQHARTGGYIAALEFALGL